MEILTVDPTTCDCVRVKNAYASRGLTLVHGEYAKLLYQCEHQLLVCSKRVTGRRMRARRHMICAGIELERKRVGYSTYSTNTVLTACGQVIENAFQWILSPLSCYKCKVALGLDY